MKIGAAIESARLTLLGPLAPGAYVRVEGARVDGSRESPHLTLYLWVETPASASVLEELRLETSWPSRTAPRPDVRERWHEDRVVGFPLDTGGISPRLTVLAPLDGPLPAVRGIVEGRVAAVVSGRFVRWAPFRAVYRWDEAPPPAAVAKAAPEAEAEAAEAAEAAVPSEEAGA